jgi:hypothetical protein
MLFYSNLLINFPNHNLSMTLPQNIYPGRLLSVFFRKLKETFQAIH